MIVTIQVCADPDEPNVSSVKLLNIQITAACGLIRNDKKRMNHCLTLQRIIESYHFKFRYSAKGPEMDILR